ncbi:MAG: HAMP domain-containing protein, partial [Anaerolineales bacterium]
MSKILTKFTQKVRQLILSVPVRWKIVGIGILPVIILGVSLNYWITTGLADWLSYILTDVRVEAAMRAGSRSVMFVTVIAALLSIILLMLLVYILTNPIEELKATAQEVASGKFETRAEVWAKDEIGSLAVSVNQMIDNFVSIHENLSRTNQQLEALNRIALAADREEDIHDVLFIALESMLSLLGLEMGWVYLYDPEVDKFHLASWKGVPEVLQEPLLKLDGEGLCECLVQIRQGEYPNPISIQPCHHLEAVDCTGGFNDHLSILI